MNQQTGKYVIITGIAIVLIGVFIYFFGNALRWMGRLPGDIRIKGEHTRFYFPVVTMLIISIVLTVIINLIRRWL